ncbi:MAG TPA: SRPBCC family protein [Terriglobales bacterium]|nr:SRPBCC family protein [Terriglobales bacterium]
MKQPDDHAQGLTAPLCTSKAPPRIERVEFSIVTKADCALVWRIFSDCRLWNSFANIYGTITWRGEPWVAGSRLRIEVLRPAVAVQERVITVCTPPRCVAWISHISGYTIEQWVLLDPNPLGGTKISVWLEFTGAGLSVNLQEMRGLVQGLMNQWFQNLAAQCDRLARSV